MIRESKFYLFLGLGVLAFSFIWLFLVFTQIEGNLGFPGNTPRTIPFFLGCCMAILGIIFLYQYYLGYRPKVSIEGIKNNEFKNVFICVVIFLAYSLLLEYLGFLISTPIILFVLSRFVLKERNWKFNILFPLIITGSIYFIFITLLHSTLPRGVLF
jgi:putative tricarboxylic transport membrane protein